MLRPSEHKPELSNVVIMGGPGQGKSTISQLIAQTYRLALLEEYPNYKLDPAEQDIKTTLSKHIFDDLKIPRPGNRRWPFTIKLSELGDAVTGGEDVSILRFMARKMNELTSVPNEVTPSKLKQWLVKWPWILILDGLDEVPSQTVRDKVFETIEDFFTDARHVEADLFVVATTRPQGYAEEMSPAIYKHLALAPLSPDDAQGYLEQLSAVQYGDDDELRARVNDQGKEALTREATSRLMVTPLQVTIMTLLLARRVSLPESKHELFLSYFSTIYEREMNKGHSYLAKLLREQRRNVEFVHERVGLALQQKAEVVGHADALLTQNQFEEVIAQRLHGDESFPEDVAYRIKTDLSAASLTRLVLLVPRAAGHIGFELRSIQEFLASSFFFSQGEQHALEPFEVTAHSTHWRHTWLLGAGRLFEMHQTLRDSLTSLIDDISTQSHVARSCYLGPLLALDVLDDDIATNSPKYLRRLTRIALELLSLAPGDHSAKLGTVLQDIGASDSEAWQLITSRIEEQLSSGGIGRIATMLLLASWKMNADQTGPYARFRLESALRDLDPVYGASLVHYAEGRPEAARLGKWGRKRLTSAATTDLAELIRPHIPQGRAVKASVKKSLLSLLARIAVREFTISNVTIRVVEVDAEQKALALVDHLMTHVPAQEVLASAVQGLGAADANPSGFLRTQLRRSLDRASPEWSDTWRDKLS